MPITCICPQCHKPLAIGDEFAGQPMRCPLCMGLFQSPPAPGGVPAPPLTTAPLTARMPVSPPRQLPPSNFEWPGSCEDPRRPRSGPAGPELNGVRTSPVEHLDAGWHMVRRGLGLVPACLVTVAATLFLSRVFLYLVNPEPEVRELVLLVAIPVTVIGSIAAVLGAAMSCLVPPESGVRKLALAASGCLGGFLLVMLLTLAISSLGGSKHPTPIGAVNVLTPLSYIPAALLALVGAVLFLFFLRGVATHFRNRRLAQDVLYCALFVAGSPVLLLFIILLLWMTSRAIGGKSEGFAILSALVVYLIGAVDLFWFLRVLIEVRRMLTRIFLDLAT